MKEAFLGRDIMKKIPLQQVKNLSNGSMVFVKCIGNKWCLDESEMNTWNIKQEDGLHYEHETENHTISFPYEYDYDGTGMSIECLIDDGKIIYEDEFGNKFDLDKIEDVSAIINDMFSNAKDKVQCDCIIGNLEGIIKRAYNTKILELI